MQLVRFSLACRFHVAIGIICAAFVLVGTISVICSERMAASGWRLYANSFEGIQATGDLTLIFERMRGIVTATPAQLDLNEQKNSRDEFHFLCTQFRQHLEQYAADRPSVPLTVIEHDLAETIRHSDSVFALASNFVQDKALQIVEQDFTPAASRMYVDLKALRDIERGEARENVQALASARKDLLGGEGSIGLGMVAIFFSWRLISRLGGRLKRLTAAMLQLASGDTSTQIVGADEPDEIGAMARAVAVFKKNSMALAAQTVELEAERNRVLDANTALVESAQRAEAANEAKSLFLANMSHELRTPLNAIIGYSEIIKNQTFGPAEINRYAEYAGDIHNSGQRLLSMINDILDTAKIDAGKLELNEEPVELCGLVRDSVAPLRLPIAKKNIELKIEISQALPLILADVSRLNQVFTNLLSNAVKFTPEGGRISVTAECDADGGLICEVGDTGIGMSSDEIKIALQPFSQVENAFTKTAEGTGLGLPLVTRLIELHGADMEVKSTKGQGTTVRIRFPRGRLVPTQVVVDAAAPRPQAAA